MQDGEDDQDGEKEKKLRPDEDGEPKEESKDAFELLADLESPWPYLSKAEVHLSGISAGRHWPWKMNMGQRLQEAAVESKAGSEIEYEDVTSTVAKLQDDLQLLQLSDRSDRFASLGMNLAVVARVASTTDSETAGMLTECFVGKEGLVSNFSVASLVSILSCMCELEEKSRRFNNSDSPVTVHRTWLPLVINNLLRRGALRPRHALVLLASMKNAKEAFTGKRVETVLETAAVALDTKEATLLTPSEMLPAFEALAELREESSRVLKVASRLLAILGDGTGLVQLLQSVRSLKRRVEALRLLASLAVLPEVLGAPAGPVSPCAAVWLGKLSGVRYRRDALVGQETAASAAFTLSRCGAWTTASANFLLMQALRRDQEVEDERPRQVLDAERVSGLAGSFWLAAVAMSGLELNAAAGRPEEWAERAPDALFAAVNQLEGSAERARVLWALHALGKASEQEELSQKLVEELAHSDPTGFRWESWQLLRELQPLLSKEEDAETPCPFTTIWKEGLTASLEAETATFRDCPRRSELASALEELADAEEPELGAVAGPFCLAALWKSKQLAIDIDMHHTVVSRVLRRQLWAKLLPDFQVKEISLADWDKEGGLHRVHLLREILSGTDADG